MRDVTDEFSFILKPSSHGIGVFAVHDIKNGTYLRLFGNEKLLENKTRTMNKKDVPEIFQDYCIDRGKTLICPEDFGYMPVGWYLNHSKEFNAIHKNYNWYASRDIVAGEEILIDYNSLEEPDEARKDFYKI
jgi:SET domain-containing protein